MAMEVVSMASDSLREWVDKLHPCYSVILRGIAEVPGLRTPRREVRADAILRAIGSHIRLDPIHWRDNEFWPLLAMLEERGLIQTRLDGLLWRVLFVRPTSIGDRVITMITGREPYISGIPSLDPLPRPTPSGPPPPPKR